MQAITDAAVWLSMGFCLAGYMVMVADSVAKVTSGVRRVWVLAGCVVVLPFVSWTRANSPSRPTLAMLINVYLFVVVLLFYVAPGFIGAESRELSGVCYLGLTKRSLVMFTAV